MTNIVFIMADDMRYDQLQYMPFTKNLGGKARIFTHAKQNIPLCGPARNGFHTGQLGKDHHVYQNLANVWQTDVDLYNHIGKWVRNAGYKTCFIGKYPHTLPNSNISQSWDKYLQIVENLYTEYTFDSWNGTVQSPVKQWQDEWMLTEFENFLGTVPNGTPWFVNLTPTYPHVDHGPHMDEIFMHWRQFFYPTLQTDVTNAPNWVANKDQITDSELLSIQAWWRGYLRELAALDRIVKGVVDRVDLSETVVIFTSDNGSMMGEHRIWAGKDNEFEVSLRVPYVAAGPGFTPGTTADRVLYACQDTTKTIIAITGATPALTQAGVDVRDIQNNPNNYTNRKLLCEHRDTAIDRPEFDLVTSATRKLVRYYTDEFEILRPDGDLSSNNVTVVGAATMWDALDEVTPSTLQAVNADSSSLSTHALVSLTQPTGTPSTWAWPSFLDDDDGFITVRFQIRNANEAGNVTVGVRLQMGNTTITERSYVIASNAYAEYEYKLTRAEQAAVTSYTDLRLRFTHTASSGDGRMSVSWAEVEIPVISYAAYDLDTDPDELDNWAYEGGRLAERNSLEADLDALL